MTTNTNLLANLFTGSNARVATLLTAVVAVSGGLLIAVPAHADYGAPAIINSGWNEVCTSRFDSNCILKETAYNYQTAAPYQYHGSYGNNNYGNNYNNGYYGGNNYYTPPVSYYPAPAVTYPAVYVPQYPATSYSSTGYNYAYSYSYEVPATTYNYSNDANDYYDYEDNDDYDYGNNCDTYSYNNDCDYSY